MAYELSTCERADYVHFRVSGDNTPADVRGYLGEIYSTCVRLRCPVVLIEEHLSGPSLAVGDVFEIASAGGAATLPAIRAIAYVDTNPAHSLAKMQFAENVAVTRGINVRVFDTLPAAENWAQNQAALLRALGSQATSSDGGSP